MRKMTSYENGRTCLTNNITAKKEKRICLVSTIEKPSSPNLPLMELE